MADPGAAHQGQRLFAANQHGWVGAAQEFNTFLCNFTIQQADFLYHRLFKPSCLVSNDDEPQQGVDLHSEQARSDPAACSCILRASVQAYCLAECTSKFIVLVLYQACPQIWNEKRCKAHASLYIHDILCKRSDKKLFCRQFKGIHGFLSAYKQEIFAAASLILICLSKIHLTEVQDIPVSHGHHERL